MPPKDQKETNIDNLRDYVIDNIKQSCKNNYVSVSETEIEEGIYESVDPFNITEYSIKVVKVLESLKLPYVQDQLKHKLIKPKSLCLLEKDELNPEKWQKLYEERMPKQEIKRKKGLHKCPRCKSFETELISSLQTRSADEGMTYKMKCYLCEFIWKF